MSRVPTSSLVALAVAAFLASLTLVAWRQSRALEALARLDEVRTEVSLALAEREELERRIQRLESRAHVVEAAQRLGMHRPEAAEIVYLAGPDR